MVAHLLALLLACTLAPPGLLGAATSPPVTCDEGSAPAAASLAVRHINEHHKHGFKFRLQEVQSSNYQQVSGGCHIDVKLKLHETTCHVTNPNAFDDCELRAREQRGAVANCSSRLTVTGGVATVAAHQCDTTPELRNREMASICPDCPGSMPLNDEAGARALVAALVKFNGEASHRTYFVAMEMAHVTSGYIPTTGTMTWIEFALVETVCRLAPSNNPADCKPRCPDRARHAFCQASYNDLQAVVTKLNCEMYPAKNSAALPPGVPEPACGALFHQSPEGLACEAQLGGPKMAVRPICPFPFAAVQQQQRA